MENIKGLYEYKSQVKWTIFSSFLTAQHTDEDGYSGVIAQDQTYVCQLLIFGKLGHILCKVLNLHRCLLGGTGYEEVIKVVTEKSLK
jgi:hypothetical protein